MTATKKTIHEEIHEWSEGLQYWERYLANSILSKIKLGDAEIKQAYGYFLEDNDLKALQPGRALITFPKLASVTGAGTDFTLTEIKDISGVNALKEDQVVPIGKNLTIIYGENGAGKSGYIRLMNNAFVSRGDKEIVSNIFSDDEPEDPSCTFTFTESGIDYELKYPDDDIEQEFRSYAVFDTNSIRAHLNEADEIRFLPSGLDFFDKLSRAYESVKALLLTDIAKHSPANNYLIHFERVTSIKKLVAELSGNTDIPTLRKAATWTKADAEALAQAEKKVTSLRRTDVTKKVKALNSIWLNLNQFKEQADAINIYTAPEAIGKYKRLLEKYARSKELSSKEGLERFKTEKIENTGSKEWKGLVVAAQRFAESQYDIPDIYPVKDDNCLLCQQPLSNEARTLLKAYWTYLSSTAEKELKEHKETIDELLEELQDIETDIITDESVLYAWLTENGDEYLKAWKIHMKDVEAQRKKIIAALKAKKWNEDIVTKKISTTALGPLEKLISTKLGELNEGEIKKQIAALDKQVFELQDRQKLSQLLDKVEKFVADHAWALKAHAKTPSTRKISTKQKEIFTAFVTEEYVTIFNKECERLNSNFGVEIGQRAQKGHTLKQLTLKGRSPGAILSEGEQRAISIADFLTEAQIGSMNRGIIFDDPVNSLDHIRRQEIAKRLVEEASVRQVIVFTHDITFLLALQALAKEKTTDHALVHIRRAGEVPGEIRSDLPWIASNVSQKIGKLNDLLQALRKLEKNGEVDQYLYQAKTFSTLLRESWERSAEELLFNDAIKRFSPAIETQRLRAAKFTPALYQELEKGMTECSKWVHDLAPALNQSPPSTTKLEASLKDFTAFVTKLKK
jgi:energy-coupling factor transporter ATP-binding protein EcfA2